MKSYRKIFIAAILLASILYFMYPGFIFALNKNHLTELSKDCTSANRYVDEIDSIAKNHSLITKSNLLKNAKFNQTACYDLEVFKLKLLSKRMQDVDILPFKTGLTMSIIL